MYRSRRRTGFRRLSTPGLDESPEFLTIDDAAALFENQSNAENEGAEGGHFDASALFESTRAEKALAAGHELTQSILRKARDAYSTGSDGHTWTMVRSQFPMPGVDPQLKGDFLLLEHRLIGLSAQAYANAQEFRDRSTSTILSEREDFAAKYLKSGRITIFSTSTTYLDKTRRDCAMLREKLSNLREFRTEFDLGLAANTQAKEALKRYFVNSYDLPQVFFGKDLIAGAQEICEMIDSGTLQPLMAQFLEQNRTWTEIEWNSLHFYGRPLGSGAQGTVRKARWNGSDCAVKIFKKTDVKDFNEEIEILEHVRHPNVVVFYGAVTSHDQHLAIVQELCAGSVFDFLQKYGLKTENNGDTAILNLATRIRYAHGIVIRLESMSSYSNVLIVCACRCYQRDHVSSLTPHCPLRPQNV